MAASILTPEQKTALEVIGTSSLAKVFYLSGGIALSQFYLLHRLSEDLDFFSSREFVTQDVSLTLKSLKPRLGYRQIEYQASFNRNLYFLKYEKGKELKLEFTYFPFEQIQKPKVVGGVRVDSLMDIAANKLFTIYQNPRGRDYYDLYCINQTKGLDFDQLRMLAKQKFDWHVDPIQLGSQLHKVVSFLDDPILTQDIARSDVITFFQNKARTLRTEVLTDNN